jgi:2-polyprenyl-3-methyl-5-hydroxy-6-metoxy-1,4-benzoquinol methylase
MDEPPVEDDSVVELIVCPYCNNSQSIPWAKENGFMAVKCKECGLIYVNPRPNLNLINEAVRTGVHKEVDHRKTAINRRVLSKVYIYKKIIRSMFADIWANPRKISWLDVGAGYGELVEAVSALSIPGSKIEGLEPMKCKVDYAKERGLAVREGFIGVVNEKYDFLSLINVFSHIPDFRKFLKDIRNVLKVNGEIFIETGNIGDLISRHNVPTELDLPDHLVFAGEEHIVGYLTEAAFSIIEIKRIRKDGFINYAKNIAKLLLGRKVVLAIPYTSPYRTILIRAKLRSQ